MHRRSRRLNPGVTLLVVLPLTMAVLRFSLFKGMEGNVAAQRGSADERCKTFVETGKTVCDAFYTFWRQRGGLPIFGYPISNPFRARSELDGKEYLVQYFQRAIFELHPENKPPYDVELAQLGTLQFGSKYSGVDPSAVDENNLPLYPNARNVKVNHVNETVPDNALLNVTTFQTSDSQEAVMKFYAQVLEKNHWQFNGQTGVELLEYVFVWGTGNPVYGLHVQTARANGLTNVTLRLTRTLPK